MPCCSSHSKGIKAIKTRKLSGDGGQAANNSPPDSNDRRRGWVFFKPCVVYGKEVLPAVIRGFLRDLHIVCMALFHTGIGDLDELRLLLERPDIFSATVTHTCPEAADIL